VEHPFTCPKSATGRRNMTCRYPSQWCEGWVRFRVERVIDSECMSSCWMV
jgi:hypothetical protein